MERRTDLGLIRSRVDDIIATSPVARLVTAVALVADRDGDGDEYIRVEVSLKAHSRAVDDDLTKLTRKIWDAVDELDERFASVRFPDAA